MQVRRGMLAALVAALATALTASAAAAAKKPHYYLRKVGNFKEPTYVATPPKPAAKGRLFVVGRFGRIWIVRRGKILRTPFLDIQRDVMTGAQRGMFSVAFAPNYSRSGRFYVQYVLGPDDTVQLDEFRRLKGHPNRADPASRRHVLNVGHAGDYHHGGQLEFGPDGYLYMSTGVDDNGNLAQRLGDLHGKILRIDPRARGGKAYRVPPDNPFVFTPGARPEIWAYGLRNPWRFSFDRKTGDMAIGDVGEQSYEEVDFLKAGTPAGANFGWNTYEGNWHALASRPTPDDYRPPVLTYRHNPECAVMGGYVIRDRKLLGLYGRYIFADMCTTPLRTTRLRPGGATAVHFVPGIASGGTMSFGQDVHGHIYTVTLDGVVYRLLAKKR